MADDGQDRNGLNVAPDELQSGPEAGRNEPDDQQMKRELINGLYDYACRLFRSSTVAERGLNRAVATAVAEANASTLMASIRVTALRILYEAASTVQMTPNDGEFDALEQLRPEAAEWFGTNVGPVLWRSAAQLPLDQYASIHLQVRLGLSPTEIADALGISHNYSMVLLSRARRAFDEVLAPELIARIGAGACTFVSSWASVVRTPEQATEAMAEIAEHVGSRCEACASVLSSLGPLADLLSSLEPLPISDRVAVGLVQKLDQVGEDATQAMAVPKESMPGVLAAPILNKQINEFGHVEEEPATLSEKMRQWLLERDIPIQAVAAAGGLAVLVVGLLVVFVLSRTGVPQPVDTRSAFAGQQTSTPIIPTSIVPTQEPSSTQTAQTATPQPTTAATTAESTATPSAVSIFRSGRSESAQTFRATQPGEVATSTDLSTPTPGSSGTPAGSDTGRIRTAVPQMEDPNSSPVIDTTESLQPWITATPQNLGASGPGNDGQLVILNSPQSIRPSEDRPQTRTTSTSLVDDGPIGSGGSSSSNGTTARPTPVPTAPPTPPPPRLGVSSTSLVFGTGEASKTVTISNVGTGQFSWRAAPQQSWILLSPAAGNISSSTSMQVRVDRELAGRGAKSGAIVVTSDAGSATITISLQ